MARVHRVQREKVLKMDGPSAQGFLSLTGPLGPRVVVSPLRAMSIKSALRIYLSVSYSMIGILLTGSLRSPPPIRLRRTSPYSGGRIGFYAFLQRHGSMAKYP